MESNNRQPQNPWAFDKKKLLEELAYDIALKYHIDQSEAEKIISQETMKSLADFKNELNETIGQSETLTKKEIEELYNTLKGAQEVVAESAKLEIKDLKESLSQSELDNIKRNLESYLPKDLVSKAKNPQLLHEHVLGFALWSANSIYITTDILYQIGSGILKTPYHLYMIVSGKWESDSFKNI